MIDPNQLWSRPIVLYSGFTDNEPKIPAFEGEDLVSFLTSFDDPRCIVGSTCTGRECRAKNGATSWSPTTYVENSGRGNENVLSINYAVFDLDHLKPGDIERIRDNIEEYEYVLHTTHSHTPTDQCYRLVFPLTRPVLPHEWTAVHDAIISALKLPADPCGDLARLYAGPTARGGIPPFAAHRRGIPIDVDEALEAARELGISRSPSSGSLINTVKSLANNRTAQPIAPPTNLADLCTMLSDVRRSKANGDENMKRQAAILGRVLDGAALGALGERHNARIRAAGILAYWLPANTPWEITLELMRPCLTATPLDEGETFEAAVEKTRKLYEGSMESRLKADADREAGRVAAKALADQVRGRAAFKAEDVGIGDEWQDLLLMSNTGVRGCEHNARLLIACAPELRGTLRWNEVTKAIEARGGPLGGVSDDVLDVATAGWLQQHYHFLGGAKLVRPALLQVARENTYDPIAEYLGELAWDGVVRLDTFLEVYFGAVPDETNIKYVRAVSRRWLISLIARALRPGSKVDTVLVLEGDQGIKKSTVLEALVTSRHFLDTALELGNKDTMQAIASSWLIELGELASLRKAETDKIKQFITSKVDKYRPPYGHGVVDSPRRCVLVGTTNPEGGYLKDRTGNRRYWPVKVVNPDAEGVERDRDLILAEAVAAFRAGERWWLVGDEERLARVETEDRLEESTTEEAIARWWYGEKPEKRLRRFDMLDVTEIALKLPNDRVDRRIRSEVGQAMSRLGFTYQRRRVGGSQGRYYEPTDELLNAPQQTTAARAAGLALVAGIREKAEQK